MIKEKRKLFVTVGNNDYTAKMKVIYLWFFASIKEQTCFVNLDKKFGM